jgi:hypothetical protein
MTEDEKRGIALGEELLGTCDMLPDEALDESPEFLAILDQVAVCCATCGWWVAPEELIEGEDVCNYCP